MPTRKGKLSARRVGIFGKRSIALNGLCLLNTLRGRRAAMQM